MTPRIEIHSSPDGDFIRAIDEHGRRDITPGDFTIENDSDAILVVMLNVNNQPDYNWFSAEVLDLRIK